MSDTKPQQLSSIDRTILSLLIVAGVVLHGISAGVWSRFFYDVIDRPDGPMRFRFIPQPVMSGIVAVRGSRADAAAGLGPFVATILSKHEGRRARSREALNGTARIILLGIVIHIIYQVLLLRTFYSTQAAEVALTSAFVLYAIIRGPARRLVLARASIARIRWRGRHAVSPERHRA